MYGGILRRRPPRAPWTTFWPAEGTIAIRKLSNACHNELRGKSYTRCAVGSFAYGGRAAWEKLIPRFYARVRQLVLTGAVNRTGGRRMLCADQDVLEDVLQAHAAASIETAGSAESPWSSTALASSVSAPSPQHAGALVEEIETSFGAANFEGWGWDGVHRRSSPTTAVCVLVDPPLAEMALPRLLHSLRRQTRQPDEVAMLVRGAASTHKACRFALQSARELFPGARPVVRVHCTPRPWADASLARLRLSTLVSSDIVSFVQADDVLLPARVQAVALAFQTHEAALLLVLHRAHNGALPPFRMPSAPPAEVLGSISPISIASAQAHPNNSSASPPIAWSMPSVHASALRASLGIKRIADDGATLYKDLVSRLGRKHVGYAPAAVVLQLPLALARASPSSALVVAVELVGGLGNRMFQLQSALGIGAAHGAAILVNEADLALIEEAFVFERSLVRTTQTPIRSLPLARSHRLHERGAANLSTFPLAAYCGAPHGCHIVGYLQSFEYLAALAPLGVRAPEQLNRLWSLRDEHVRAAKQLLAAHARKHAGGAHGGAHTHHPRRPITAWIGVHVRRFPERHHDTLPTGSELRTAVEEAARSLNGSACVMVFSNDPGWALEHISRAPSEPSSPAPAMHGSQEHRLPCVYAASNAWRADPINSPGMSNGSRLRRDGWATNAGRDLAALKLCERLVLTSGTFGIFAGLLHGGQEGTVWAFARAAVRHLHRPTWRVYPPQPAHDIETL